jgi:hypothetical protein
LTDSEGRGPIFPDSVNESLVLDTLFSASHRDTIFAQKPLGASSWNIISRRVKFTDLLGLSEDYDASFDGSGDQGDG